MIVAGLTEIIFTGFLLALNLAVAGTVKSIFKINRVEPPAPAASIRHATPDDLPATPPTFS